MKRRYMIKFHKHCSEFWLGNYCTSCEWDWTCSSLHFSYKLASPTRTDYDTFQAHVNRISSWRYLHRNRRTWARACNTSWGTLTLVWLVTRRRWRAHLVLCYVDQFLLTREFRGSGTVALCCGEGELYALEALTAELISRAILQEIGLSFLIHTEVDCSTARAVATKQGARRKMEHFQAILLFIQDSFFRKRLTMSAVKTHLNPSDIGKKALGRERFYRLRSMLGLWTELTETNSLGSWHDGQRRVANRTYVDVDESKDRHMWASVDLVKFSQCSEGGFARLTQPRDARSRVCWIRVMLLHSWSHNCLLQ